MLSHANDCSRFYRSVLNGDANQEMPLRFCQEKTFMSRFSEEVRRCSKFFLLLVAFALVGGNGAAGQYRWPYDQKTALDVPDSRAEHEAEQLVSLSPEKIISILQKESGLLLQFKRVLVRKAYEQGRILDPEDLTDDSLFTLVREDATVRVLATLEIEKRRYIQAKPSEDEQQRNCLLYGPFQAQNNANSPGPLPVPINNNTSQTDNSTLSQTQEASYWLKHDDEAYPPCLIQPYYQAAPNTPRQPSLAGMSSSQNAPAIRIPTQEPVKPLQPGPQNLAPDKSAS